MIDADESTIQAVSIHHVGNASLGEPVKLSDATIDLDDERVAGLLRVYFLTSFNTPEYHSFSFSNDDHTLNPLFRFTEQIFEDPESLHENSVYIAQHLHSVSQHPNIKPGDLYVAYFSTLALNGQHTEAIGIFKSENKEPYLKLKAYSNQFDLAADEGINIRKLDKGCIILNQERGSGYKLLFVDNSNRADARYWVDLFLNVRPWSDAFHHTQDFMVMAKHFVADQIPAEFSVSRADQIDLLNKSVNYFKTREQFNKAEFETEVFGDVGVIESFRKFERSFKTNAAFEMQDEFEISAQAVKRQARVFKSVLKLDRNFHIYIHGNRELIEKGFDPGIGKHYYKIYFDEET